MWGGGYYHRHIDIQINIDPNEVVIAKSNPECNQGALACSLGTFDLDYQNYRHRVQNQVSQRDFTQTIEQMNAIATETDVVPAILTFLGVGLFIFGVASVFLFRSTYDPYTGERTGNGWYIALPVSFVSGIILTAAARYYARAKVRSRSEDMKGVARRANADLERLTPAGSRTGAWVVHYRDNRYLHPLVTLGFWVPPADGSGVPPPAYGYDAVPAAFAPSAPPQYLSHHQREGAPSSAAMAPQSSSVPRFCAGCGRPRQGGDLFCSDCGKRFG